MKNSCTYVIRKPSREDFKAIEEIYSFYVENSAATFEVVSPSQEELFARYSAIISKNYPYYVIEDEGIIRGYCYATSFRERAAYSYTVENSIYICPKSKERGYGRLLLSQLIQACKKLGYVQMVAVTSVRQNKPSASVAFHKKMGFKQVGFMPGLGYKFGEWMDVIILQKELNSPKEYFHKKSL